MQAMTSYSCPSTGRLVTGYTLLAEPDWRSRHAPKTRASDILRLSPSKCNGCAPEMGEIGVRAAAGIESRGPETSPEPSALAPH
jgi:hypothetical protein